MRYRSLGKTGLSVSVIGFGASSLGNVFEEIPAKDDSHTVDTAIDCGINLFDVSPYYGLGLAEMRLGAALAGKRDQVVLATKCGRRGVDDFDFSAAGIVEQFEDSLRRLRTDHVDVLQVHDIEFGDIDTILRTTLPAMQLLRQQGKARFLGITGYWPDLLARVADAYPVDTVLNYCQANLFANNMDRTLAPLAQECGFGLMNASPLHMGLLGGIVPAWHPAPQRVRNVATEVNTLCRRHNVNPVAFALHACLQHSVVASTFIGLATAEQVQHSCTALEWSPDENLIKEVRALIAPVFNIVWPQGRTENADSAALKGEALHA